MVFGTSAFGDFWKRRTLLVYHCAGKKDSAFIENFMGYNGRIAIELRGVGGGGFIGK